MFLLFIFSTAYSLLHFPESPPMVLGGGGGRVGTLNGCGAQRSSSLPVGRHPLVALDGGGGLPVPRTVATNHGFDGAPTMRRTVVALPLDPSLVYCHTYVPIANDKQIEQRRGHYD